MSIRLATRRDAPELSQLVIGAAQPFREQDFTEMGWQRFVDINCEQAIAQRLQSDAYYCLCYCMSNIQGMISIHMDTKIDQLFVRHDQQGQGIARALWHSARDKSFKHNGGRGFWVRASSVAVPVYRRFGFREVGGRQSISGIYFQKMRLDLSRESH